MWRHDGTPLFFFEKNVQAAEYFAVGDWPPAMWRHYALSFDVYTHFTYIFDSICVAFECREFHFVL
jgi:hypothetical protein